MPQKLYVHIGLPKTGTTALQTFLGANAGRLRENGYDYVPDFIHEAWEYEPGSPKHNRLYERLDGCVGKGNDIIVSDEGLTHVISRDPQNLSYLKERYPTLNIKILVYLRRQDLSMESLYNLMAINGAMSEFTWHEYPRHLVPKTNRYFVDYEYASWLKSLEAVFGHDNLIVRVYDRQGFFGGSLYADFMNALGIDFFDKLTVQKKEVGPSLDGRYRAIAIIQRKIFPEVSYLEKNAGAYALYALNQSVNRTNNKTVFSTEERKDIVRRFEKSNAEIARTYLDSDLPLFNTDDLEAERTPDVFDTEELELLPVVLNKMWFETIAGMKLGMFNYIKLEQAQRARHQGVPGAKRRYFFHKLVHSLGKRLFKKQFEVGKLQFNIVSVDKKSL